MPLISAGKIPKRQRFSQGVAWKDIRHGGIMWMPANELNRRPGMLRWLRSQSRLINLRRKKAIRQISPLNSEQRPNIFFMVRDASPPDIFR
jgi:hypothetical protein